MSVREYADDWLARAAEIAEKYHPEVMYFDWWLGQPIISPHDEVCCVLLQPGGGTRFPGVIDIKDYALDWHAGARDFERGLREDIEPQHWQTDTSISNISWGYVEHDESKSADFIVHQLIDIVSKNGNLLLNIGPRPDGTIPDEVRSTLLDIGSWLKLNGEAIYDTTPWRFTARARPKFSRASVTIKTPSPTPRKIFALRKRRHAVCDRHGVADRWTPGNPCARLSTAGKGHAHFECAVARLGREAGISPQ